MYRWGCTPATAAACFDSRVVRSGSCGGGGDDGDGDGGGESDDGWFCSAAVVDVNAS